MPPFIPDKDHLPLRPGQPRHPQQPQVEEAPSDAPVTKHPSSDHCPGMPSDEGSSAHTATPHCPAQELCFGSERKRILVVSGQLPTQVFPDSEICVGVEEMKLRSHHLLMCLVS